jgi:NAD(P)-dependent dehydrogenase (short-subunit alcohol dehydrogenase family)
MGSDVNRADGAAPWSLGGKVALVTGGSRGLGRAIALSLASAGADVAVVSRNQASCEEVASKIRGLGRNAASYSCHVGHWHELDGLVDDVYRDFGKVDILVNNAGKSPRYDELTDVTESMFDSVVGLNLKGPFRLSVIVGTRMKAAGGGAIINITSIEVDRPSPSSLPYAAAKAGLTAVTEGLARALAPTVRVNAVQPGAFRTDISKHWPPEMWDRLSSVAALGRVGEPDEICGAVLFLASEAGSYTTGSRLRVDGGVA